VERPEKKKKDNGSQKKISQPRGLGSRLGCRNPGKTHEPETDWVRQHMSSTNQRPTPLNRKSPKGPDGGAENGKGNILSKRGPRITQANRKREMVPETQRRGRGKGSNLLKKWGLSNILILYRGVTSIRKTGTRSDGKHSKHRTVAVVRVKPKFEENGVQQVTKKVLIVEWERVYLTKNGLTTEPPQEGGRTPTHSNGANRGNRRHRREPQRQRERRAVYRDGLDKGEPRPP